MDSASRTLTNCWPYVEGQGSLGVGDLGACDRRLIAGGLQAPLPLVSTFEQVADPNVELLRLVQIFAQRNLAG